MSTTILKSLQVTTPVTQSNPATDSTHLIRLGEAMSLFATLFQGAWSGSTTYGAGQIVAASDSSVWLSLQGSNLNHAPAAGAWWSLLLPAPVAGVSSYVYVAYASDNTGTGFSLTPGDTLIYMAVLISNVVISSPNTGNFTGLWRKTAGPAGAGGTNGTNGTNGVAAYLYLAYASDNIGTGFSLTPGSGLNFIAALATNTVISTPQASNFTGLWKQFAFAAPSVSGVVKSDGSGNFSGGATADDVPEKSGTPTNLYFTAARVLGTLLTGLSGSVGGDVAATDNILAAIGKLQNRLKAVEGTGIAVAEGIITLTATAGVYPKSGQVTGLALVFTPTKVQLTVSVPDDPSSLGLIVVVVGVPTTDGFKWTFTNGQPNLDGYQIFYRIT